MNAVTPAQRRVRLAELLDGVAALAPDLDRDVTGLTSDSRAVRPGDVFFARRGGRTDAARFIDDAIAAGATAVVRGGESATAALRRGVPEIRVTDLDGALGTAAARYHGEPARQMRVVGVTGTNGKTSVCHLAAQGLDHRERRCAIVGTLGAGFPGDAPRPGLTTPDPITLQASLAELRRAGAHIVMLEVSSHALDQGRAAGTRLVGAVFTNLTRDHLDYHEDFAAYGRAKQRLFEWPGLEWAVVNVDDEFGHRLAAVPAPSVRRWRVSLTGTRDAEVRARIVAAGRDGLELAVAGPHGERGELRSALLGAPNAANLACALAVLLAEGTDFDDALARLGRATAPAGRLERHHRPGAPLVVVDFAHTPDALDHALATLRGLGGRRLWCVFGCGGDRDRGKRAPMGAAAAAAADELVITDDNPRGESGDGIVEDILAGVPAGTHVRVERDRGAAIALALAAAGPDDVVLVAGKGHEAYQDLGGERRAFSDSDTVRRILGGAAQ